MAAPKSWVPLGTDPWTAICEYSFGPRDLFTYAVVAARRELKAG